MPTDQAMWAKIDSHAEMLSNHAQQIAVQREQLAAAERRGETLSMELAGLKTEVGTGHTQILKKLESIGIEVHKRKGVNEFAWRLVGAGIGIAAICATIWVALR